MTGSEYRDRRKAQSMNLRVESVKLDQLLSALASRPSYSENAVDFIEGNLELDWSIESTATQTPRVS